MFVPVGTDAPIYHRPFGTGGLIVANVVVAIFFTAGGTQYDGWILQYGEFLPLEWISSAFLHLGTDHLVGNMLFLWAFGLVVEGKLGWWRFLALYLLMCASEGFLVQLTMLHYSGEVPGAGGASGVIFALMVISLIWAPKNCIQFVLVFFFGFYHRSLFFDVTILTVALCYVGLNMLGAWLSGFEMGTAMLHLVGAFVGLPFGILLLKKGWVDCENWDLFSIMQGKHIRLASDEQFSYRGTMEHLVKDIPANDSRRLSPNKQLKAIRRMIDEGKTRSACALYLQLRAAHPMLTLDERRFRRLFRDAAKREEWADSVQLLREYVNSYPQNSVRARLTLADILVHRQQRPRAALRALKEIDLEDVEPKEARLAQKLQEEAHAMVAEGVVELQLES